MNRRASIPLVLLLISSASLGCRTVPAELPVSEAGSEPARRIPGYVDSWDGTTMTLEQWPDAMGIEP